MIVVCTSECHVCDVCPFAYGEHLCCDGALVCVYLCMGNVMCACDVCPSACGEHRCCIVVMGMCGVCCLYVVCDDL